jgi:hypothetical protein
VIEDEVIDENPGGVGTTFRVITQEKGRRMEFDGLVTRHEPPTASAAVLRGPVFDIHTEYSFEDLSGRTRVTQRASVSGKGFARVMIPLFGRVTKVLGSEAQGGELANLKELLESGADHRGE